MKRRTVTKNPRAEADLLEQYVFIGDDNLDAAERFLAAAEEAFTRLGEMPRLGRRWRSDDTRLEDIRVWPIPGWNYLVFYRQVETAIEVVRILHGAQDVTAIIVGEEEK